MSPELDELLVKTFPLLYQDRNAPMNRTAMCWGFDVGDGWFSIIWHASQKIEKILREKYAGVEHPPRASQVKEKFGTMRFYMSSGDDDIWAITDAAEAASVGVCENCGALGSIRDDGWLRTLCDECHETRRD